MRPYKFFGVPLVVGSLFLATPCLADQAVSDANPGSDAAARRQGTAAQESAGSGVARDLTNAKPMERTAPPKAELSAFRRRQPGPRPKDLGTVTKDLGGGVSTTPASPEVERAIGKGSALSSPDGNDKGMPRGAPDPAVGPNVERTVFGADNRVWIKHNTKFPFSAMGLLVMDFPDGVSTCSGTLVGARYVLTAAHCLYDEERGRWADSVEFYPGRNGRHAPFGAYQAARMHVLSGYVNAPTRHYDWEHMSNDLALVKLRKAAGNRLGWLSFGYDDRLPRFVTNIVGYPGDKRPPYTLWRSSCEVDPADGFPDFLLTYCDTYPGSSGSGMYDYDKRRDERTIYGVNVASSPQWNTGVRLTGPYYCWLQQTMGRRC